MKPTNQTPTRRGFFASLIAAAVVAAVPEAEARGRSSGGYGGGGSRGGCGSRGGAGYRKANGKCADRNE